MNYFKPEPMANALIFQSICMAIASLIVCYLVVREMIKPLKEDEKDFDIITEKQELIEEWKR